MVEGGGAAWKNLREEENTENEGMVQPIQQYVAACVKGVEWGLGTRGLRMGAELWAGITVEVTEEAGVVPRCRTAAIGTHF